MANPASQPASQIAIPTSSTAPPAGMGAPTGTGSIPSPAPSSGGNLGSTSSGPSGQPTQPLIRTLEPRANSQSGTPWAGSLPAGQWAGSGAAPSSGGGASGGSSFVPDPSGFGGIPTSGFSGTPPSSPSPPPGSPSGTPSGSGSPTSGRAIDLASLPAGGRPGGQASANAGSGRSGVSGSSALPSPGAAAAAGSVSAGVGGAGTSPPGPTSANPYGFDPQYQWLRGVLCYSSGEGCWRLRYVPPGCPVDTLGGWVILCHPGGLAGFCPGEPVEVQGQLIYKQWGACQLPIYQVQQIRRIRA